MRFRPFVSSLMIAGLILASVSVPAQAPAPAAAATAAASAWQPLAGSVEPGAVNAGMLGQDVVLAGTVVEVVASNGERTPHQIVIGQSGAAKVMVVFWPDAAPALLGDKGLPPVGTKISAKGKLGEHRGNLQVRVKTPDQLRMDGYGSAAAAPVAAVAGGAASGAQAAKPADGAYYSVKQAATDRALIGKEVSVKGTVKDFRASWSERAPNILGVEEEGGRVEIVFWMPTGQPVPAELQVAGTTVYAAGTLQEYRDRMQLKLDEPTDVSTSPLAADKVKSPGRPKALGTDASKGWPGREAGKPAPVLPGRKVEEGAMVAIRDIGPDLVGNTVTTVGSVRGGAPAGAKEFTLSAADGYIVVRSKEGLPASIPDGGPLKLKGEVVLNQATGSAELRMKEIVRDSPQ